MGAFVIGLNAFVTVVVVIAMVIVATFIQPFAAAWRHVVDALTAHDDAGRAVQRLAIQLAPDVQLPRRFERTRRAADNEPAYLWPFARDRPARRWDWRPGCAR